jgi:hypothetical protein
MVSARFAAIVLLPSPASDEVTTMVRGWAAASTNCRFVRRTRKASARGDHGSTSTMRGRFAASGSWAMEPRIGGVGDGLDVVLRLDGLVEGLANERGTEPEEHTQHATEQDVAERVGADRALWSRRRPDDGHLDRARLRACRALELGDGGGELLGDGLTHGLGPGWVGVAHGDVDEHRVGRGGCGHLSGDVAGHADGCRHGREDAWCREQLCVGLHPLLGERAALEERAAVAGPRGRDEELGARLVDLLGSQRGCGGDADADEDHGNDDPPSLPNHL